MKGNPHRAVFVKVVGGYLSGGISYPEATGARVILEPDTDAGRAASFAALEAADRSTADHAQILVVRADPEPGDALSAPRGERAESITHPHRPVIACFLEVQRRFPPRRRTGQAEAGERAS